MYRNFVEKDDYAAYNRGVPLRSSAHLSESWEERESLAWAELLGPWSDDPPCPPLRSAGGRLRKPGLSLLACLSAGPFELVGSLRRVAGETLLHRASRRECRQWRIHRLLAGAAA